MKRSYAVALAFILCTLIVPFFASADVIVDAPHFGATSDGVTTETTCTTCHTSHVTLGSTGYNNICQSCHRAGDPAAGKNPLTLADAANPYNNHTSHGLQKRFQTSHRWDGSDTVPQAGAMPPTLANMTTGNLASRSGNQLACVRCHNQHSNVNGKFLRVANNTDQMCMDCHRTRNVQSHLQGSHPVGVAMLPQSKTFNNPPLNANPSNPTSDLAARLTVSGGVVNCSTCHGVHFTDSRSSTVDGGANFYNLSSGDGYLLRTDHRGAKVAAGQQDNLNICSNCHADKKSHNVKGQDVQCVDCHGAHVEYDPKDPNNTKGTNIYLVRRNVTKNNMPNQIYFRYTGSKREYKNSDNTGVCQGCHDVSPPGGLYPAQHASTDPKVCNSCHYHGNVKGSFSGACRGCHGFPPSNSTVIGAPNGLATPATNAGGSVGAHVLHAQGRGMDCSTCHNGYSDRPMPNGSIDLGFAIDGVNVPGFKNHDSTGSYTNTSVLGTNPTSGTYTWTGPVFTTGVTQTCNNIYCHGATLSGGSAAVSWTAGSAASNCGACHGVYGSPPATGSHVKHANVKAGAGTISCDYCHGPHPDNGHVNGSVEWNFTLDPSAEYKPANGSFANSGATVTLAPSAAYGQCNNIYCHSSAQGPTGTGPITYKTPTWGQAGPLTCNACHQDMATDPAATGSHVKHAQEHSIACNSCHSGYTASTTTTKHADGNIDVIFPATGISAGSAYTGTSAPGDSYGSCNTSYCHSSSRGTYPASLPLWGAANTMNCGSCHDNMSSTAVSNGSHLAHASAANATGPQYACSVCHATFPASHIDQKVNLSFDATATTTYSKVSPMNPGTAFGTCSASKCHGQAAITWGASLYKANGDSCSTCHSSTVAGAVTAGAPFYTTAYPGGKQINTSDVKAGWHTAHVTAANKLSSPYDCSMCHGTVAFGTASHMNGSTDFVWAKLASGAAASGSATIAPTYSVAAGCSNYCHGGEMPKHDTSGSNRFPKWNEANYLPATLSVAACGTCHGFPPSTGNSVLNHAGVTINVTQIGKSCNGCHPNVNPNATSYANIFLIPSEHINGTLNVITGTCDACHGYPPANKRFVPSTNNWANARAENYSGGGGAHTINGHVPSNAVPGAGFNNCITCHNINEHEMGGDVTDPGQIRVSINQKYKFSTLAKQAKYTSNRLPDPQHVTGRCSNISCHFQRSPKWN